MKKRSLLLLLIALVFAPIILPGQSAWESKGFDIIPAEFDQYEVADIFIVNDTLIWSTAADWTQLGTPVPDTIIPLVLKSTDGGDSWEVYEVEAPGRSSWKVFAFDEDTAWITTQSYQPDEFRRGLFLTTDGGASWTEKLNDTAGAGWIHFFDEDNAVCYNVGIVKVTTDGGDTWEPPTTIPTNGGGTVYSVATSHSIVGDTLWRGTGQGEVFRSMDKGHNWEAFPSGASDNIASITFANASTGLLVQEDYLRRSTDGGASWNIWPAPAGIFELTRIEGTQILVATSYEYDGDGVNQTMYTDDLAESWVKVDSVIQAYAPEFSLDENGNWHGWSGAIRTTPDAPTFYKLNSMLVSVEDLLAKAQAVRLFPNPIVDQVTIQTGDFSFEYLQLFDAQGRMLAEQPVAPTTSFTMDLSALSSGIFFLEIRTEGGTIIKKVVKG